MNKCEHHHFEASVVVNRLEDTGTFYADVQIYCSDCETPMLFVGMGMGVSPEKPMMSVDRREARLPIAPAIA